MPRRLGFVLAVGLALALGCMTRPSPPTGDEGGTAAAVGNDFLVWRHNGTAPMSTWVQAGAGVVHTSAGLALPGAGALWEYVVEAHPLPTLDCACYDPHDLPASEAGKAEQRVRCTRETPLATLRLRRPGVDDVPLLADVPDDQGSDPGLFEGTLTRTFTPLGSVGNWLFVAREDAIYTCGALRPLQKWTFEAIDLERQAPSTIFGPAELARIEAEEKVEAARALCVAPDCFQPKPDATTLTRYWPAFTDDGALVLKLQFTTEAALATGDDLWDTGTRSVVMDAKALPAALAPFSTAPAPIRELWTHGGAPETGGWTAIDPSLRKAFGG